MKHILIALCVVAFGLSACSSTDKKNTDEDTPVETLNQQAAAAMEEERYGDAIGKYERIEQRYPYAEQAVNAQLMAGLAAYRGSFYDQAILSLDRFIELHPGHEQIDYAYYLKALSYYEQIADVKRDQELTSQSLDAFNALLQRYPESKYARDAKLKRDLTLDHLAGKEMEIGRYYLKKGHINAAINRFKIVVSDYQTTMHVAEALHRLVEAYLTLGLKQEAAQVAAVLGHNYPGSQWYADTYKLFNPEERRKLASDRSWFNRNMNALFTRESDGDS